VSLNLVVSIAVLELLGYMNQGVIVCLKAIV